MTRLPVLILAAPFALAAPLATPIAAQDQSETFTLPTATPTPSPAPAGPADERAGVAIPPLAQSTAAPEPRPAESPRALATPILGPVPSPAPGQRAPEPRATENANGAGPEVPPLAPGSFDDGMSDNPQFVPGGESLPDPAAPSAAPALPAAEPAGSGAALPDWWPFAAGATGALVLLGGGLLWWKRRRKPKALRLAAPLAAPLPTGTAPDMAGEQPRIDLTLEIITATRSVMMFTVEYRLTMANRSDRAVTDLSTAVQLACARASAGNAASPGAAQSLAGIARIGPHQARSVTGQAQLPLSAIAPLRQGSAPLFIPLVHVTLEGEGLRAMTKSFVIGTPSSAGRVHPILLDQPPGAIAGLVAQPVAIPPVSGPVSDAA